MTAEAPPPGTTIAVALADATTRLSAAGIEAPRREARLLLATALEADAATVIGYPERGLTRAETMRLDALIARRAAREPAARLIGHREFWSLDFTLSEATLVPRPESETLIEAAIAACPDRTAPLRVLDFGTGTGCLLLAFISEYPSATGLGVDLSAEAVSTARRNAVRLALAGRSAWLVGNWGEAIRGGFDVILANPPYIEGASIDGLAPEVARYEPRRALDGGPDGLSAYRTLAPDVARLLTSQGCAVIEVGAGQHAAVAQLWSAAGLVLQGMRNDLYGIPRALVFRCRTAA